MDQPTTLEVRDFLPLGSRASAAIDKARDYVNAMRALGKVPGAITMYAADYDFVFNGVSRSHAAKYKEGGGKPPPISGLTFNGTPLSRGRAK